MNVLQAEDQTPKELAREVFVQSVSVNNEVEQLSSLCELHYQVELVFSLDNFIQLDDTRMSDRLQNFNLSDDPIHVIIVLDFVFFKYFDCDFLSCDDVDSVSDLAEGPLTDGPSKNIVADIIFQS